MSDILGEDEDFSSLFRKRIVRLHGLTIEDMATNGSVIQHNHGQLWRCLDISKGSLGWRRMQTHDGDQSMEINIFFKCCLARSHITQQLERVAASRPRGV